MAAAGEQLERGREAYAQCAWNTAHESLAAADELSPLEVDDLELLATAAYMVGHEDEYLGVLERTHQVHLDADRGLPAARCALWVGITLAQQGEMGRAGAWLGRAQRLVEDEGSECAEQGYLLLPLMFQHEASGDLDAAVATAAEAAEIGKRYGDADLFALAAHGQGHMLVTRGSAKEGLALLDESMLLVATGKLSPIVSGIVYCGVILGCRAAYELRRAKEWTEALTEWCDAQPDMVAFTGRCLVHRAEILELQGAWPDALAQARRAAERATAGQNDAAAAEAVYRQGDVHRLQGDLTAAEEAYREASRLGHEPQPGLTLLRLAQGDVDAAAAAIRRALGEASEAPSRAALLPAYVEVMLAAGDREAAGGAAAELERAAEASESELLTAFAAQARGAVELADGDAAGALLALRRAAGAWAELEAPYEAARVRLMVGLACGALGDDDTAALELEAARGVFEELGAASDLARLDALRDGGEPADSHGLTARELEVLRLVAGGATNKAIAAELVVSERTVDRHVSNIFVKLGCSSRAAATAYAYQHKLV